MIIGKRAGHSDNFIGSVGIVNEHEQMKILDKITTDILVKYGHKVIDCNSNGYSENEELKEGSDKANSQYIDLFLSLHMNSFNGKANGTECLVYNEYSRAKEVAKRITFNLSKLGFFNRGVKYNSNLYEMKNIEAPNIIVEVCFCDSKVDIDIYNRYSWEELGYAICNGIDSNIPLSPPEEDNLYYIETKVLDYGTLGIYLSHVVPYFLGVVIYALSYSNNIWIETEYLTEEEEKNLREILVKEKLYYKTEEENGEKYIVTNYLPYGEFGVNILEILKYFGSINCYLLSDDKKIWFDTQWLNKYQCEKIKNSLGSWVYDIKS